MTSRVPADNPGSIHRLVVDKFLGPEPQGDFLGRTFRTVASVNQVVLDADAVVPTDRARWRLGAIGRAHHAAYDGNGFADLEDYGQRRAGREELEEWLIKRFALVVRVVLFRQRPPGLDQPHGRQTQPLL